MSQIKHNILIVDDDEFVREIHAEQLQELGYDTVEAPDGREGLILFQQTKPDVVLLDLRMPKLDGFQVLASLVKNSPNTPVIIVSGEGTMEDVIKALRLGAWDYLIKPIQDNELLNHSIEKVLERAKLITENQENKDQLKTLNQQLELKVKKRTKQLKRVLDDLELSNQALKRQSIEGIKMLSGIIEMRPGIYKGHSKFVAEKSVLIAKEMGADENEVQNILFAGLLLQIGKMSLPDKMLSNSFFKLQAFERKEFLNHALEGQKLLSGLELLQDVAFMIRCQYEKYDGSGIPDGLAGEEIPLGTRILTVIQDYFTYFHGITTGKKMILMDVMKRLVRFKGKDYDPAVVDLFVIIATGAPYETQKLIVETEWFNLQPGMHIVVVKYRDITYLKNRIATNEIIEHIKGIRDEVGAGLIIKVQTR